MTRLRHVIGAIQVVDDHLFVLLQGADGVVGRLDDYDLPDNHTPDDLVTEVGGLPQELTLMVVVDGNENDIGMLEGAYPDIEFLALSRDEAVRLSSRGPRATDPHCALYGGLEHATEHLATQNQP